MDPTTQKIGDPDLRRFAQTSPESGTRQVIVELAIPQLALTPWDAAHLHPKRGMVGPASGAVETGADAPLPRRSSVGPPSPPLVGELFDPAAMDRLEASLKALGLADGLVRLDASQAFGVVLTPEQINAIVCNPLVGAVRPNRTHSTTSVA